MRAQFVAIFLISLFVLAPSVQAESVSDEKLEAIKRYTQISKSINLGEDAIKGMATMLPAKFRDEFVTRFIELFSTSQPEIDALTAKYFTVQELNAMSDFYSSEIGHGILKKTGPYYREVAQLTQQRVIEILKDIKARHQ